MKRICFDIFKQIFFILLTKTFNLVHINKELILIITFKKNENKMKKKITILFNNCSSKVHEPF